MLEEGIIVAIRDDGWLMNRHCFYTGGMLMGNVDGEEGDGNYWQCRRCRSSVHYMECGVEYFRFL